MKSRRQFLKHIAAVPGIAFVSSAFTFHDDGCGPNPPMSSTHYADPETQKASKSMRILVLGGTGFFGTPFVQYAKERGHQVTLFNRGITNPHLFPELEKIKGDRLKLKPYDSLLQKEWDLVVDAWKGNPLVVKESASALKPISKQYLYISSISVYGGENYKKEQITEESPFKPGKPLPLNKLELAEDYTSRKQWADISIRDIFKEDHTVLRCHGLHGFYCEYPGPSQYYWVARFQRGGHIICPGDGMDYFQGVHVQDVAKFAVRCGEQRQTGVFNVGRRISWQEHVALCGGLSNKSYNVHWLSQEQLNQFSIRPLSEMVGYVPRTGGPGFFNVRDENARNAGLQYRSNASLYEDELAGFNRFYPADFDFSKCSAGLSYSKEQDVLKKLGFINN